MSAPAETVVSCVAESRRSRVTPMISRVVVRLAAVVLMTFGLMGCSESYRYKLTLAVNTPDGVKRASDVVEVIVWNVWLPASGTMHKLCGQALYLDLGVARRPLIALLTSQLHPKSEKDQHWTRDAGPDNRWMSGLYGQVPFEHVMDDVRRLAQVRGQHRIIPADLPDLVTFADINDPRSVMEVDPSDLQATLGAGVTWNEITLESTDDPVTKGIEQKLTWLPSYFERNLRLDGIELGSSRTLANILSWPDFDESCDLKRRN